MEAAAHASKKRKSDRIDGQEPPGSGNRDDGRGLNFISRLPDAVLGTIISLLPTKDGARTQAISRRWRPLWRSAPLNLVADSDLSGQDRKRFVFVSKIISDHPGPARRLSLPYIRLRDRYRYRKIDGWLRSRSLTSLQEIEISFGIEDRQLLYPLPPSALRFAPTLRVAKIGCCHFPNEIAPSLNFPHLTQLTLYSVTISEDVLHGLLSRCPVLESLLLEGNVGIGRLRISSPTLRSIGFCAPWDREDAIKFQELVIEDAPCLERLLPLYPDRGPATIRVIRAPNLEILGLLSNGISKLHLGTTIFQEMIAVSLTTTMRTVKVLVLDSAGPNLDAVVDFLKCFPCLERLYVKISHQRKNMKNVRKYDPLDPIECLELHLKKMVVTNYDGKRPDVDFAKYFVLNAKVLKEMEFRVLNNCNDKWMADQHRRLQLENMVSRGARFKFKRDFWSTFTHNKHTHDLSMADPFDSSLCRCCSYI